MYVKKKNLEAVQFIYSRGMERKKKKEINEEKFR